MMNINEVIEAMKNIKFEKEYTVRQRHNERCEQIIANNKADKETIQKLLRVADNDYVDYWTKQNHDKAVLRVLTNNYRYLVVEEVLKHFIEVFNKYTGKKAGEKTKAKFETEIKEVCGDIARVYVQNSYSVGEVSIYADHSKVIELRCNYVADASKSRQFFDSDNKFVTVTDEWLTNPYKYIEDIDEYIKEAENALEEAKEAQKKYNEAMKKYNDIAVYGNIFNSMDKSNSSYVSIA